MGPQAYKDNNHTIRNQIQYSVCVATKILKLLIARNNLFLNGIVGIYRIARNFGRQKSLAFLPNVVLIANLKNSKIVVFLWMCLSCIDLFAKILIAKI